MSDHTIEIRLSNGMCRSCDSVEIVTAAELGFEDHTEWCSATDKQKLEAVRDYFEANGYPEFSWKDMTDER